MIYFQKLRYKNLLSSGDQFVEVNLNANPITLVSGSNGAGKSTMMCALCLALFGKPFRKISKSQLVNSINGRALVVEVEFKIGRKTYLVRRGIKPNIFEIFCNGELVSQDSRNHDYQKMLEQQILKMNYKTFTQVVILGSAKFVPFMQLSAADRRAIIEDLLDIQIFTTMNKILKQRYDELRDNTTAVENELRIHQERITVARKYIESLKKDKNKVVEQYQKKLQLCEKKLLKLQEQNAEIASKIEKISEPLSLTDSIGKKIDDIATLITKVSTTKKNKQNSLAFFDHQQHPQCPTCRQDVSTEHCQHMTEEYNREIAKLESNLNLLLKKLAKYQKQAGQLKAIGARVGELTERIRSNNVEVGSVMSYKQTLAEQISSVQGESGSKNISTEQEKLTTMEKQFSKVRASKDKLIEERQVYDVVGMLLKDTGIKTKIISQYLPIMNQMINKYLNMLDFSISFELDENFDETIKSRYRDEFSYNSFSEGEKQRIDLALLFAWRDIAKMRNSANTNLLILDEVFDSSLDTGGTEEFMKLLKTLDDKTNTFIITHHGDALYDKFNASLRFEKVGNFSRMVVESGN